MCGILDLKGVPSGTPSSFTDIINSDRFHSLLNSHELGFSNYVQEMFQVEQLQVDTVPNGAFPKVAHIDC